MTIETRPIELWEVDKLVPYAKNAKKHPPEQIKKLVAAIKEFSWTQPIIIDGNGVIIIGHGRRLAAIEMGLKRVPVVCRRDLSPAQVNALRLSDNRVTSTEYDMSLVQDELRDLLDMDFDLSVIGFDDRELEFSTDDLSQINNEFFVEDIGTAVQKQKDDNGQAITETDDVAAPVADALGFKRVSIAQSRQIRDIMNRVESRYSDKKGAEALIDFLARALGDQ